MVSAEQSEPVWMRGLKFIEAHLDEFAFLSGGLNRELLIRLKPLGELALTASLLCRGTDLAEGLRDRLACLLSFAWGEFGDGKLFIEILEARPDLIVVGSIYPSFERHGLVYEPARELLRQIVRWRGVAALEFPPWRALDLALAWRTMRLPSPWALGRLFPLTWLAQRPEPWLLSDDAAYSITHTVFYMTDFGEHPDCLDVEAQEYLRCWCPAWMEYYRSVSDLDLYAELALALECVGQKEQGFDPERVLAQAQAEDGMIPGPVDSARDLLEGVTDARRRRFLMNYHTTLVGLLASFALSHGLSPATGKARHSGSKQME